MTQQPADWDERLTITRTLTVPTAEGQPDREIDLIPRIRQKTLSDGQRRVRVRFGALLADRLDDLPEPLRTVAISHLATQSLILYERPPSAVDIYLMSRQGVHTRMDGRVRFDGGPLPTDLITDIGDLGEQLHHHFFSDNE